MTTPRPHRVLLIDDDEMVRKPLVTFLKRQGFEVDAAGDGADGLKRLLERVPDLVLCDVDMPGAVDGYEVVRRMRDDPMTAAIPFLFITGNTNPDSIRHAMGLGADDYICKPFRLEAVLQAVRTRIRRYEVLVRRMDALRLQLAGTVSHEFLTPLNGVLGFSRHMLDTVESGEELTEEELRTYLGHIVEGGERLLRLARRHSLYAELAAQAADPPGCAALRDRRMDVEIADQLRATVVLRASGRPLELAVEPSVLAVADDLVNTALVEIAENALKFSPQGSAVALTGKVVGDWYRFSVADEGLGMTPEQVASIGAFMQFDRKRQEQQGCGLGLAIARLVAEIHRGALQVQHRPGGGTVVSLQLPIAREARVA